MAFNQGHPSLLGKLDRGGGSSHQQLGKAFGNRHLVNLNDYTTNAPDEMDVDDF
jgi:hypothetical protein